MIKIQQELNKQEEQHKQQVIHAETIGMMTKYQLVFIKLETLMNKISSIIKQSYVPHLLQGFDCIKNNRIVSYDKYMNKSKYMSLSIKEKFVSIERVMKTYKTQNIEQAFQKIQLNYRITQQKQKFQLDQEKIRNSFLSVITQKDNDIVGVNKKHQELVESVQQQKQKESELNSKLKLLEQTQSQLDNEVNQNKRVEMRKIQKHSDQKIRQIEQDNLEIQDRILGSEDLINNFIKEMSELLDSHEISTNPDSDGNGSYDQQIPMSEYQSQRQYASQQTHNKINNIQNKSSQNRNIQKNFYSNQLTRSNRLN